ncbi:hypothetical protein EGW08_009614 [Elysia chlorotica]|uniref:RNA polymerase II subunit B1 CTD phosphatase RPAP2 homolog n=1 Tax=Elysia chlorotica TaxID=188477 RepID=A0A3S1C4B3_ELYCH|nr:hypothetical protein EGW08_009614 [Elysia chlorotica]
MPQSAENKVSIDAKANKLENVEKTLRTRVECEERAFRIVNKLIDSHVEGTYLVKCGSLISKEHYSDIVEERAITWLCGYPACPKSLGKTPNKKYHVCTKTNKVYEISERKNFCSSQCFRASRHFSAQIPDSPLWMRDKEDLPAISLLDGDTIKGMQGDEVIGSNPKQIMKYELESLEELDKKTSTSKRSSAGSATPKSTKSSGQAQRVARQTATKSASGSNTDGQNKPCISDERTCRNNYSNNTLAECASVDASVKSSVVANTDLPKHFIKDKVKHLSEESAEIYDECNVPLLSLKFDELTTKEGAKEQLNVGESSKEVPRPASQHSVSNRNPDPHTGDTFPSKLDHLKALMSRRKNVLIKMVDVQTVEQKQLKKDVPSQNVQLDEKKSSYVSHDMGRENVTVDKHSNSVASYNGLVPSSTTPSPPAHNATSSVPSSSNDKKSLLQHVCTILKTWVTMETVRFLTLGEDCEAKSLLQFSDPRVQQGYGALCQRLDAQEKRMERLLDGSLDGDAGAERVSRPLRPVPDYKALREQTEAFSLSVMEFITGKKQTPKSDGDNDADKDSEVCLPTVDAYNQHQIRVRIVMDRLDKCLPNVLLPLNLSIQDVSGPVRELVYSCRLGKDNIVLRPGEWSLASLLILKLLAVRYPRIESAFKSNMAQRHLSALLSRLGHDFTDLHSFAESILQQAQAPNPTEND